MKTQNRSGHVPTANQKRSCLHVLGTVAASKPKHRPIIRLQNATRTKFQSKTNSEQIATA
jgi:hypothetical protein